MFVVSLPIREMTIPEKTGVVTQECIIAAKGKSWNINLALVSSASPVLKELLGSAVENSNEIPVLSIKYEQPKVVEAFVEYLKTSRLSYVHVESHGNYTIACLKHYADVYVLAEDLGMKELHDIVLQRWSNTAGARSLGTPSTAALIGLIQHIYSQVLQIDTNFRLEVLKFVASYRQRCERMAYSLATDVDVRLKCSREVRKQVSEYRVRFPDLDSFLLSREPLAWKLATMYEENMQNLVDLYET